VVSFGEDGMGKGSVRTFAGKNVLEGLRACHSYLDGFGGHQHAAGLRVTREKFEAFQLAFDQAMSQASEVALLKTLMLEKEVDLEELNTQAVYELERLGPFGPGNPEPLFYLKGRLGNYKVLKGRHLKFKLENNNREMDAIWFHAVEDQADDLQTWNGEETHWVAIPEVNRFRGQEICTLRVKDHRIEFPHGVDLGAS